MPNRISTTDRVHALLREEIVSGKLTSGSLHSIYALATRYGVSRTLVRDAVLRLSDSGMVRIERNRGVRIRGLGVHDIREVFETHLLIEVPAASYAAAHSTPTLIAELEARLATLADVADDSDAAEFSRRDRDLHRRWWCEQVHQRHNTHHQRNHRCRIRDDGDSEWYRVDADRHGNPNAHR